MKSLQPLHRHAEARLIVFVEGTYTERAFEQAANFTPGDFVIRPGYFAHDGIADAGTCYVRLGLTPEAANGHFSVYGWCARRGRVSLAALRELTFDPAAGDAILAGSTTFALETPAPKAPMEMIAAALCSEDSDQLAALADAHRLRPWELTRAFKSTFGLSPNRYRQQARVQRALKLMAETETPLPQIAVEAGFADHSHLCRALRRATGRTPSQVRRAVTPD